MEAWKDLLDAPQLLALAAALGWLSGIRLYAVVFLVGAAIFRRTERRVADVI